MGRLNQWLALVANFGVLIGIGFLAHEISVNTRQSDWNELSVAVMTDAVLIPLMRKASQEGWNFTKPAKCPR
jgi:hypothetical protein